MSCLFGGWRHRPRRHIHRSLTLRCRFLLRADGVLLVRRSRQTVSVSSAASSPFILIQRRTDLFLYFHFGVMLADLSGPPSTLEEPPSLRLSTTRNRGSSSMTILTVSFESPKPHADVEKNSHRNKSQKRTSHRFSHGSRC